MKWTEEQQKAITAKDCNLLVSAGAGSGKTAVLVERIINKVLNEKIDITNILVVTFTNAAATEMKERILNKLYEKLDESPEDTWIQQQIININSANITTIHSFCLSVIKQYYYEIGIEPNMKIANEIDNQLMKYEILQEIFDEQYELEQADKEFLNLLEIFNEKNENDNLKDVILKIYEYVTNQPFKEKVYTQLFDCINADNLVNFEQTVWGKYFVSQCIKSINTIITEHDKILDILSDDQKQIDFFNSSKLKAQELLNIDTLKWDDCISKLKVYSLDRRVAMRGYDEETKELIKVLWKNVQDIAKELNIDILEQDIIQQSKVNQKELEYLINMVKDFDSRFKAKKQKNKIIDFNDFEHYALEILIEKNNNGKIIPSSIAKEYRKKFVEILIDEYQDSNYVQDYILNLISTCDEGKPNIFMVGDVKQSIYKFRGAKPEIFLEKYNTYATDNNSKYMKINLYKNFRSRTQILEYINYIFSNIMSKEFGEINYTSTEFLNYGADYQDIKENDAKIELDVIEINDKQESDNFKQNDDEQEEIKVENVVYEAQYIINRIKELMEQGYKVLDKKTKEYRTLKYSDIVILLRNTKGTSHIFNQVFKENNVPIYIDNKVGYLDELEVSEVISFLQIIDNPYQDIPFISVLKSPFGNFNDNELAYIRQYDKTGYFYTAMQKASVTNEKVNNFLIKLEQYSKKSKVLSVSKLIWNIYEDYKYLAYMKRYKDYEGKKANLILLFERAKQFEQSTYKGLFNFIHFILKVKDSNQDMGSATILSENDNVVRLMSIHKSKGLEFTVVFLANTDKKFNTMDISSKLLLHQDLILGNEIVDVDKRITYPSVFKKVIVKTMKEEIVAEEMRMLYVALTRAKEKLIITGITKDYEKSVSKAKTRTKESLNSYLSMIQYVMYNTGYNKELINNNYIKYMDINKKTGMDIEQEGEIDLQKLCDNNNEDIDSNNINEEQYTLIDNSMKYEYDKKYLSKIPHKISVSEIKRLNQEQDIDTLNIYISNVPQFLNTKNDVVEISPLEKGNIYHYVFQQLDFSKNYTKEELKQEITQMNKISEREYSVINIDSIYAFTQSHIYNQIQNADKVYKEHNFMLAQNVKEVADIFGLENVDKEADDTILIQGTIDMFYISNNEITIIDYKTDRVTDDNEIIRRYKIQLKYYQKAVEQLLNMKVKNKYIYLINGSRVIEVE